jgi:glycosyltransferase involved in cell wall biosynthesis
MTRIGVDARELLGDATGVGRYLGELLRRWTSRPDAATRRFVLFTPEPLALALPADRVECRILPGRGAGTWWEQTALRTAARVEALDLFFAPAYTAPLGLRVPLAVTIHDVSFLAHPEWFRWRERMRRRWLTTRAASAASVILTDSQFSCSEISRYIPGSARKIRVIPPGLAPRHRRDLSAARAPLVLYVGSIFNRRRLPDLIDAFSEVARARPDARLSIVGANRTWPRQDLAAVAAEHGVSDRVDVRSYAKDDELATLYETASAFVFLSEYEGFGLTPLEALAAGVPAVVLDTPVAREVCGDAAIYVRADDRRALVATLHRLLTDPEAGAASLREAPAVLNRYSWERAADETLAALEAIAPGPGRPDND